MRSRNTERTRTPPNGNHIAELVDRIRECQTRNSRLHIVVMDANESWLNEHTRQAFRPRALGVLPDLEASVLRAALMLPESQLDVESSWQLTASFLPPSPPTVVDARRLIELLLAPPRNQEGTDLGLAEPEAEELAQRPDRFNEQDYRDVDRVLEGVGSDGALLSGLMEDAKQDGYSECVQTLLYLVALREYGESDDAIDYVVDAADGCFILDSFSGDDLWISPSPSENLG